MTERYSDNPAFGAGDETNNATDGTPDSTGEASEKVADNIKYSPQADDYEAARNAAPEAEDEAPAPEAEDEAPEAVDDAADEAAVKLTADSFDPGEYTVDEVLEYLDENPDERDTVLEAETAGKGRKGILESSAPEDDSQDAAVSPGTVSGSVQ